MPERLPILTKELAAKWMEYGDAVEAANRVLRRRYARELKQAEKGQRRWFEEFDKESADIDAENQARSERYERRIKEWQSLPLWKRAFTAEPVRENDMIRGWKPMFFPSVPIPPLYKKPSMEEFLTWLVTGELVD